MSLFNYFHPKALDYNVLGGKQFRVMQIILGYKDLVDKSQQTPEKMYQIYMACWALELVSINNIFSYLEKKKKKKLKWTELFLSELY